MATEGSTVLNPDQQFVEFIDTMTGIHSVTHLFSIAKNMGVGPEKAQEIINLKMNGGTLSEVPLYPTKNDDLGVYAELDGEKFYTHHPDNDQAISLKLLSGKHIEEYELSLLKKACHLGDTIIDVGANIGSWSIFASEYVGPDGKVIAFEPDPRNFMVFHKNIATRGASNIQAYATALGNQTGYLDLHINPRNAGDHRCWESDWYRKKICVPIVKLDEFWGAKPINILKIDTQGYEVHVLNGAKETIRNSKNLTMFLEFWPTGLTKAGSSVQELEAILTEFGFRSRRIEETYRTTLDVMGKLSTLIPSSSDAFTNLICTR